MISDFEQRTALYRFYDKRENLLYVGISNDPWRRWREHVYDKPWYPEVKHQAVTWYETEEEARLAETRAIRAEHPKFNVAGAVRPPEARRLVNPGVVIEVCAFLTCIPGLFLGAALTLAISARPHSGTAVFAHALAWVGVVTFPVFPIAVCSVLLVRCAPLVYRFGCWLDRNFGEQNWQQVADTAKARREQGIPGAAWLTPRETFRVRRRMRVTGSHDYLQALEEDFLACDRENLAKLRQIARTAQPERRA
jgi:hypothetical protein